MEFSDNLCATTPNKMAHSTCLGKSIERQSYVVSVIVFTPREEREIERSAIGVWVILGTFFKWKEVAYRLSARS